MWGQTLKNKIYHHSADVWNLLAIYFLETLINSFSGLSYRIHTKHREVIISLLSKLELLFFEIHLSFFQFKFSTVNQVQP